MSKGYIIEYGNTQKVFVEEERYITVLEYLKFKGQRVQVTQWVDHLDNALMNVLDAKSFGYIIEYSENGNQRNSKKVFVPEDELDSMTKKLHKQGCKPTLTRWTNRILEQEINKINTNAEGEV